jgi:hypothetical protein
MSALRENCNLPIKDFAMVATMENGDVKFFGSDGMQDVADGTLPERIMSVYTNSLRRDSAPSAMCKGVPLPG